MSLRDRCKGFLDDLLKDTINPHSPAVEDLMALVVSELGRAASEKLEDSLPLCLYFSCKEDREEFIAAVIEAKPGMIAKRWPR